MPSKFSPSINIIRDSERSYKYLVTPNATSTVEALINDFNTGIHCSVIIGSYGTGKSSMLWAFEQTLRGSESFFDLSLLKTSQKNSKFVRFVGEYQSIIDAFSEQLGIRRVSAGNQEIFDALYQLYEPLEKKGGFLTILIDELGKFLEYAAKHDSEKELYFIQQLAEFVNDPKRRIILISTLHQSFDAYSTGLDQKQRNEWSKVRGRLKEHTFNEPIEQLLFLAADYNQEMEANKLSQKKIKILNNLAVQHRLFGAKQQFADSLGLRLYPLDIVSAYCLTIALQRYGQHERSLFTFLESREYKARTAFSSSFYNLVWLHDYLWSNFYSLLNSVHNQNYKAWTDIKGAIERAEAIFRENAEVPLMLIKIVGLLNIFAKRGSEINLEFLESYLTNACQVTGAEAALGLLTRNKIIIYSKFNDSYRLFEGTDVDIDQALLEAAKKVDEIIDMPGYINRHFGKLPYVTAKEVTYRTGTPRIFKFIVSAQPENHKAAGEIDGHINLIISNDLGLEKITAYSKKDSNTNVYGYYKSSDKIRSFIVDIEKAYRVRRDNPDDRVVQREMDKIIDHYKNLLKHYFIDAIYSDSVIWIFRGKVFDEINSKVRFNRWLSEICTLEYPSVPIFKNELINRHKISTSIHTARKDFFEKLVNHWNDEHLGFDENYPPGKTIYISLLKVNGLHRKGEGGNVLRAPYLESSFIKLWLASEAFMDTAKDGQRPISELYSILLEKPFKIKQGLAELWVPTYLFIKRDDFALFGDNGYINDLNETLLLMLARNAGEYSVKAFNLDGVRLDLYNKYREFLNFEPTAKPNNQSFIESIKPFLTFYRQLPEYSRKTMQLTPEAIAVRKAIANAIDPEKTFFEDFPNALHTSVKELHDVSEVLKDYSSKLKEAINELRNSYDELILRFESFISAEIVGKDVSFEEYKGELQKRHRNIQTYMMANHQKVFVQRVNSPLDDKRSWLSSIAQALLNKPLESIKDDEVKVLWSKFRTMVHELDNLTEISAVKYDRNKERIFKFEITADKINESRIIKIPASKFEEIETIEKKIAKILKDDQQLNIAVLAKLLQEQIKK